MNTVMAPIIRNAPMASATMSSISVMPVCHGADVVDFEKALRIDMTVIKCPVRG